MPRHAPDLTDEQNERVRVEIRAYMRERDINGTKMAKELGISSASLSNILNAKSGAGTRTAVRLAQILGLPHETFISAEPPPPSLMQTRALSQIAEALRLIADALDRLTKP